MNSKTNNSDWNIKKLGEIGQISGGSTPSTRIPEYWNGNIPWLTPSEITKSESLYTNVTERYITQEGVNSCGTAVLPAGTVMMTSRATIGNPTINTVPMTTNQGFINIIPNDNLTSEFLAYWIMNNKHLLENLATGVTFKELSKSSFKNILINFPSKSQQQSIVDILSAIKQAAETRNKEIRLEEELFATLLDDVFHSGLRKKDLKETMLGEVPENWEVANISQLMQKLQYGTSKKCGIRTDGSFPVLRIPNVVGGRINTEDLKYAVFENSELKSIQLVRGDILFVRTNGNKDYVGRCAVYDSLPLETAFASYLIRLHLDETKLLPKFFRFYCSSANGKRFLSGKAMGTADGKFNINSQTIKNIIVPVPPINEQEEIITLFTSLEEKNNLQKKELQIIDEFFSSTLEKVMSGKML